MLRFGKHDRQYAVFKRCLRLVRLHVGGQDDGAGKFPPVAFPQEEIAVLDLRGLSPARGEGPAPGGTPTGALSLPRRVLDLTVQLPVGSAEGSYEVAVQQEDDPLVSVMGEAVIENQITTLRVRIDTREIPEGEYQLGVRQDGLNWRLYPLILR